MANHNAVTGKSVLSARCLAELNVLQEQRCKNVRKHVTDVKRGKRLTSLKYGRKTFNGIKRGKSWVQCNAWEMRVELCKAAFR